MADHDPVARVKRDWDAYWLEHDRRARPPARTVDAGDMLWVALAVAGVLLLCPLLIEVAKWLR